MAGCALGTSGTSEDQVDVDGSSPWPGRGMECWFLAMFLWFIFGEFYGPFLLWIYDDFTVHFMVHLWWFILIYSDFMVIFWVDLKCQIFLSSNVKEFFSCQPLRKMSCVVINQRIWGNLAYNRLGYNRIHWLVVWNMNFVFPYIGNNHPNWLSYFSREVETTNQIHDCTTISLYISNMPKDKLIDDLFAGDYGWLIRIRFWGPICIDIFVYTYMKYTLYIYTYINIYIQYTYIHMHILYTYIHVCM